MALRLTGVSKRYGDQRVLDGVSLHVRPGDCYGFLGHNGAGKTTAMRIALGLLRPDAGRVLVEGFDAADHPLEARARLGALIDLPGFHAHLSGRRNLVLLARLQGFGRREALTEADRVLEAVGLSHAAAKAAGHFSQGMRQRLGIAQAILGTASKRPRIVLLDEPTNGLDPEGIEEMRRLLRRLTREDGVTVLLSSHQLHELSGVCNRVGILRQGRMLVEEETETLLATGAGRHVVRTGDDAAARRALDAIGVATRETPGAIGVATRDTPGAGFEADLMSRPPGDVLRALVGAGIDVQSFTRREGSLEEIYLRFARDDAGAAAPARVDGVSAQEPRELIAPGRPVGRALAYDVRRWCSSPAVPLAVAAPALVAAYSVIADHSRAAADASELAAGTLASATRVTGFAAASSALTKGLPLLALTVAMLGALSVAGEFGRGTLRHCVLRPVGRARLAAGKTLAAAAAALTGYVLVAGTATLLASAFFGFEDLSELLPNGKLFPLPGFTAAELWPELWKALASAAPPVVAFAAFGVLIGSFARTGAGAVVGVLGATLVSLAGVSAFGAWCPVAHVPWFVPEADRSPLHRMAELATGASNAAPYEFRAVWVPLAAAAVAAAIAAFRMRRREIP